MRRLSMILNWQPKLLLIVILMIMQGFMLIESSSANTILQKKVVTGNVTDAMENVSLIGVSVVIKGTTMGTVTDIDGNFSIEVNANDVLIFSFIGYLDEEITITDQTEINLTMSPDLVGLDEVVVIGYGIQKKKLNTGASLNVKGEDIQKLNTSGAMDALQGISPGVSITQSSGQPGSGTKVYIRGIGTIGDAKPLYVVDGIQVSDIDYLSPSDIESIDVLKDAASAAIYGSRAANGVILVSTKKGKRNKSASIEYDMFYGVQNVAKDPDLLNAQQYAEIMNEARANNGKEPFDYATIVPRWDEIEAGTYQGTNWFDEITIPNAPIQSHALNINGGSDKTIYAAGVSYLSEQGVLGKQSNSTYKRLTMRFNSEHLLKELNGHDFITFGQNFTFTNSQKPTVRTGSIYWNDVHNTLVASPFLPVYDSLGNYHTALDGKNGYPGITTEWNPQESNPVGLMEYQTKSNENNSNSMVANAYLEIQPIVNLKIRSVIGTNAWYGSSRQWVPVYKLSETDFTDLDRVDQREYMGYTWTMTNTVAYNFDINSTHNISAVAGQEIQNTPRHEFIKGRNEGSNFQDWDRAYLSNVPITEASLVNLEGKDNYGWGLMSYFGRLSYDYKEKYLFTAVVRADGSSNFAEGYRWGTFPSFSAGWILTNEEFMQGAGWLDYMKLRASWGQNGNQNIDNFYYLASLTYDQAHYHFGPDKAIPSVGAYPPILPNPEVTWETSEQLNIGTDINFLNSRLQLSYDWYQKDTRDWLVMAPILDIYGTGAPYINGGTIRNQGSEIMLKWSDQVSDFKYSITGTMAYNKNKVVDIANDEKIIHGPPNVLSQGTLEMFRAEVGYPVGYFYGYETAGILQNETDVTNYVIPEGTVDGEGNDIGGLPYFDDAKPGDVIFVDQNNDGLIDEEDKKMIGDPNPDYIFGIQLNLEYKGIYLMAVGSGQAGHQIARSWRSFNNSELQNYTTDVYDRWHGEGTSNRMPILSDKSHRNTKNISDIFIEDADFFRISNLTIGYNFSNVIKNKVFKGARVYFTAKNLITFTKYSGMDPEIGYGPDDYGWASGIDLGLYPQSKTYMLGLSVNF